VSRSAPLPLGLTAGALAAAMAEPEPDSLAAATRLRRDFGPDVAAAALHQAALRRQAAVKFGAEAARLFFTRAGLEQATRPVVADHHASRFVAAGVRRVIDLGCGIGSDALAFARAGLEVVGVERDPELAAVAAANLGDRAMVVCADAEKVAGDLLRPGVGMFCDPGRRNLRGRLWRVEDFSPSWDLVRGLLDGRRTAGVKLGPALPHDLIPTSVEAEWLSDLGDVVEVGLWAGPGAAPGARAALVRADRSGGWHRLETAPGPPLEVRDLGRNLFEPDGAVIRSGGITQLGRTLHAGLLDPHLAYLTGDTEAHTPFATTFTVRERLPYHRKTLRRWVAEHNIGKLEIKQRGIVVDPAELRRELRPSGPRSATMIISRTPHGTLVAVADRVDQPGDRDPGLETVSET
jgi:SAM-dependent methyltransferase